MNKFFETTIYCQNGTGRYKATFEEQKPEQWFGVKSEALPPLRGSERARLQDAKNGIVREERPRFNLSSLLGKKKEEAPAPVKQQSMSDFKGSFYTGKLKCPTCGKTGFFRCGGCHNLVCHDGTNKAYCPICKVNINISGTIKNMSGSEKDVPDAGNNTNSKYTIRR